MPTPEEYAAAAQALGGNGAGFMPGAPQGDFASTYMNSAPLDAGPVPPSPLNDALAAANAQPGAKPPVRAPFGYVGEPMGASTQRESANAHSPAASMPVNKAYEEPDPTGTTDTVQAPMRGGAERGAPTMQSGPQYHAAGWDDSRSPIRKGTFGMGRDALAGMGEAEAQAGVATRLNLAERGDAMQAAEEAAQQRMAERAAREQQRQLAVEVQNRELDKALADAKDAKVSREGFLERNPGSILMAIGAVIGGALSARTGQPNEAMKALDNTIQTDLQLQRDAANRKDKAVDQQHNLISMMRTRFGDERQADVAAEMAQRQLVAMHLDRLATKAADRDVEAKIGMTKADNDQKMANLAAQWDQMTHYNAYATGGTGAGATKGADDKEIARQVQLEDGRTVLAPTADEAVKAREAQVSVKGIERLAERINKLRDEKDSYIPLTANNRALREAGSSFVDAVRQAGKSGTLDKGFVEQSVERFGDPTGVTSRFGQAVSEFAKRAREQHNDQIRSFGGERVERGYGVDKGGQVVPTATYTGERIDPRAPKTVKRESVK